MVVGRMELLKWIAAGTLALVLLIGGLGTIRHYHSIQPVNQVSGDFLPADESGTQTTTTVVSGGFFHEYRLNRDRLRSKQVEMLQEVLKNSAADTKSRDAAGMRLMDIASAMEKELKAENLIKAEGYQECVVMVQDDSTAVVVQSPPMQAPQIKHVKELAAKAVSTSPEKLSLVTRGLP